MRVRPLTLEVPKALLPIAGVPLIEYTLAWLKNYGISDIAINLHHLGGKIKDYLNDGSRFGVKIVYSREKTPLGTAGGVKRMEHFFDSNLVVFYGDILTDFCLTDMIEFHKQKKAIATIVVFEALNPKEVGLVELNTEGRVLSILEKQKSSNLHPPVLANGGVYVLEKEVLDYIPEQGFSDFAYDIFPRLLKLRFPVYGFRLKTEEDYFIDIGTLENYKKANSDAKSCKVRIMCEE